MCPKHKEQSWWHIIWNKTTWQSNIENDVMLLLPTSVLDKVSISLKQHHEHNNF